ncbi:origin recognition complex, subunit 4, partial [Myriangium duriaei CBS 260.36]
ELLYIQGTVLQRLTRRSTHFLVGMGAETKKVANLIEQTVTAGESNSMVLIGARGSGKSAIVDSIIAQQRLEHGDDFHIVRLSGFIHTDDRIAIREIWRQLGREMEIEEDNQVKNYADTMTTLLALLSHPSETGQAEDGRMAKSVVIILDEFDLFTTHPRQTLLYNLFDIAQSRKAPIAVLGLTTRFDVAESLEKRVKSRFSHRQVYVPLAKNFAAYKEMCKSCLVISGKDLNVPESTLSDRWSKFIAALFDSSTTLNTHLQSLYHTTKSVPAFQTSFLIPLSTLRTDGPLDPEDVQTHIETSISLAPSLAPPDSNLTLLPSLSTLELALLICAARLLIIHDTESASFPLAYDEYKSLASKARIAASAAGALATGSGARVWGVGVARLAWEGLVEKGLVLPVNDRARGGGGVCRVDVSLEELGSVVEATVDAAGMGKWCREI